MRTTGRVWTRAALLRRGGALAGSAAAGAALAACGTAQGGTATAPQKPSAPVEVEFWQVAASNNPTEAGRIKALQAAEAANADFFKIKFA